MPTTLITHSSAIGLGVMSLELLSHVKNIDSVFLIDFDNGNPILDFSDFNVLDRVSVSNIKSSKKLLKNLSKNRDRKFLFLERSRGLAKYTQNGNNICIPMWEQRIWEKEAKYMSSFIAVTRHTQNLITNHNLKSQYIPWGVSVPSEFKPVRQIKRILHNAGSLGSARAGYRKGTPEAISIFQKSGVWKFGVTLTISTWGQVGEDISQLINMNPEGINVDNSFKQNLSDIYNGYDLLLYPSKVEGHPLPALEAMARGIPTFATNAPPINELDLDKKFAIPIFKIEKDNAFVNIEFGASKLRQLIDFDFEKKSNHLRNLAISEYSWQKLSPKYEEVLK